MSELFTFMGEHPFLTFVLVFMVTGTLSSIAWMPFRMVKQALRSANIRKQGWPPPHCDADGDFKPEPETD